MTNEQRVLAENSFGYGRWNAQYWFIGLEERMTSETGDNHIRRADAFTKLNKDGLCDCFEFHSAIGQLQFLGPNAILQDTWKCLIWLLMRYLNQPHDDRTLLEYQSTRWGTLKGDTCLAELDGLPFDTSKPPDAQSKRLRKEVAAIRRTRIDILHDKLMAYKPELVVMYGKTQRVRWEIIAGRELVFDQIVRLGSTKVAFVPHPNMHGRTNAEWEVLGKTMRRIV